MGGVAGGIVLILAIALLFCLRRKSQRQRQDSLNRTLLGPGGVYFWSLDFNSMVFQVFLEQRTPITWMVQVLVLGTKTRRRASLSHYILLFLSIWAPPMVATCKCPTMGAPGQTCIRTLIRVGCFSCLEFVFPFLFLISSFLPVPSRPSYPIHYRNSSFLHSHKRNVSIRTY